MRHAHWLGVLCLGFLAVACGGDDSKGAAPGGANGTGGDGSGNGGSSPGSGGKQTGGKGGAAAGNGGTQGGSGGATGGGDPYGQKYEGGLFHLGPVDYEQTVWPNACASATKYAPSVQAVEGRLLAGLWNGIPNVASYCDACIGVTTGKGKSAILRVVTYGDTTTNSIDVSPEAFAILNSGEDPRAMTWQFVECPETGKVMYEFQTGANEWWTSFWVRNARKPLEKVEVKSANHASYFELRRETDGTLNDDGGFGKGKFTIRLTGLDGSTYEDTFDWPSPDIAGQMLTGQGNF